jgi:hypothetical protein
VENQLNPRNRVPLSEIRVTEKKLISFYARQMPLNFSRQPAIAPYAQTE